MAGLAIACLVVSSATRRDIALGPGAPGDALVALGVAALGAGAVGLAAHAVPGVAGVVRAGRDKTGTGTP